VALVVGSFARKVKYAAMGNEADQAGILQVLEKAYRSGRLGGEVIELISNMKVRE
jgi:hypothetical protein